MVAAMAEAVAKAAVIVVVPLKKREGGDDAVKDKMRLRSNANY